MPNPSQTSAAANILSHNRAAATAWNAGGEKYDRISRQVADAIEHCVDRLEPAPHESILDVATGTGWTARQTNARGATVTGVDLGADVIDAAKRFDKTQQIDFRVADAEALPFSDQQFDAVVSTFGVMFCGDPEQAASELARVCRPGGRLALAVWADHGGVYDLFQVISRHKPSGPAPAHSPFDWSQPEQLEKWLGKEFTISTEAAVSYHREKTAHDAWEAFSQGYGPVKSLLEKLDTPATKEFQKDFEQFHEDYRTDMGILVPRPYVLVKGIRKG